MTLAIETVRYVCPGVDDTKAAINKQFAQNSLKIAQDILANGSWSVPTPWYVGTLRSLRDTIESHTQGLDNVKSYQEAIKEYMNNQNGLITTNNLTKRAEDKAPLMTNSEEEVLVKEVQELHETVRKALAVDFVFKAVAGAFALGFVVTLLPISAIPLSASAIAGKAFGVAAVAYAVRCAWNTAYPPDQKVAKDIQELLTTDDFWTKLLSQ
jgi:hypothetical protein